MGKFHGIHDVLIVGAGPAGLAVAATLKRSGHRTLILEADRAVGARWRTRYDELKLNTMRTYSELPGYKIPKEYGRYPTLNDFVSYLEAYTRFHALDIQYDTLVKRVNKSADGEGWEVLTSRGAINSRYVVIASGFDAKPHIPSWSTTEIFPGTLMHSSEFRSAQEHKGREVLVVGAGNSGIDIAGFLVKAGASVTLSMRTPPNLFRRDWGPIPLQPAAIVAALFPPLIGDAVGKLTQRLIFGNLSRYGIPPAPEGIQSTFQHRLVGPAVDDGFIAALKLGKARVCAAVESIEGNIVNLEDGTSVKPDVVICATGYCRGLESLVSHLDILDVNGLPKLMSKNQEVDSDGLFFIGFRGSPSGQIRLMPKDAKLIAKAITRQEAS